MIKKLFYYIMGKIYKNKKTKYIILELYDFTEEQIDELRLYLLEKYYVCPRDTWYIRCKDIKESPHIDSKPYTWSELKNMTIGEKIWCIDEEKWFTVKNIKYPISPANVINKPKKILAKENICFEIEIEDDYFEIYLIDEYGDKYSIVGNPHDKKPSVLYSIEVYK